MHLGCLTDLEARSVSNFEPIRNASRFSKLPLHPHETRKDPFEVDEERPGQNHDFLSPSQQDAHPLTRFYISKHSFNWLPASISILAFL